MPLPPPPVLPLANEWQPIDPLVPALNQPAPALALGHCFYTPALGRVASLLHHPAHIQGEAFLTPETLMLHFQALPDDLRLELQRAHLAGMPLWIGTYALRCQRQPTAPTSVWYHHTREDVTGLRISTLKLSSNSPHLKGYLAITAYDSQRQLVSGYYEVRANDQRAPTSTSAASEAACTIILAGDFDSMKLKLA
jgi:hypothetical protein